MTNNKLHAVTGASGFSGKYITRKLLAEGHRVITLTGNPDRPDPFKGKVKTYAFDFENTAGLAASLQGVDTLFNTYWVRFDHGKTTFRKAVENSKSLLKAAQEAGVRRIVHVSISNAEKHSHLPYFKGKAEVEQAIRDSGISHAILRPAVIFGDEDILINNIAWVLRRFPFFPIAGKGDYRLQPIFVDDMAALAVEAGKRSEDEVIEAIGPETFSYKQLVEMLAGKLDVKLRTVSLPPSLVYTGAWMMGILVRDVFLTWDELKGLMSETLFTPGAPEAGETKLSDWVAAKRDSLGGVYANELKRHYKD
ncbi:MAG: NAD(P)H-binding protein [Anaerolineae bacterium]|nr:NAD(P)H-binding protein [Anaerolineae bacterium]